MITCNQFLKLSSCSREVGCHGRRVFSTVAMFWLSLILPLPASAIDPGRVQGSMQVNGENIVLTQAYAHLHGNAKKLPGRPRELRLLLSDREVPQKALAGLSPLLVEKMAGAGQVQGLLLKLDPDDHRRLEITLLSAPPIPGQQLPSWTINTPKPAIKLKIHPQRVGGSFICPAEFLSEIADRPTITCSLLFSAPLFHELNP